MKNIKTLGITIFLIVTFLGGVSRAENLQTLTERFYTGLADIIEQNMNSPQDCVSAVNRYYQNNQQTVEKIRRLTKEALEKAAPMMEKMAPAMQDYQKRYESMSEEELEALERKHQSRQPEMSPALTRYSKALDAFIQKYPNQGMEIAMKAMELMPR